MTSTAHSPLESVHEELGATFTDFSGWRMPLKYSSDLAEHHAVRERVGIFDLSHMGEITVTGADSGRFLDYAFISYFSELPVGRAKYSMIVTPNGGVIDDLITYRLAENHFLVIPNAGNEPAVWEELNSRARGFDVSLSRDTSSIALIAVQGPLSEDTVCTLLPHSTARDTVRDLRYYRAAETQVAGVEAIVARTGYTGEDGFELYVAADKAATVWDAALNEGARRGGIPCGLAARDSLRLEAAMPLYGHELDRAHTPLEAQLGVLMSRKKPTPFVGDVLLNAAPPKRLLVGLRGDGRRAARAGCTLFTPEGSEAGVVTSGQLSPTLGYPIALAYVERELSDTGTELEANVRGKRQSVRVVSTPFYTRR